MGARSGEGWWGRHEVVRMKEREEEGEGRLSRISEQWVERVERPGAKLNK